MARRLHCTKILSAQNQKEILSDYILVNSISSYSGMDGLHFSEKLHLFQTHRNCGKSVDRQISYSRLTYRNNRDKIMAYSDFDLKKVKSAFNLSIRESEDLFSSVEEAEVSVFLSQILKQNVPLALAMATEKACSELIIINILLELKKQSRVSFFSGIDFTVDKEKGLNGFCDFLISRSSEQMFLEAPVVALVEAKNEKIVRGFGQCIAEMIGARIYNEREGHTVSHVFGAVTTGHAWKFLKLESDIAYIDIEDYYIKNPGKILGILLSMVKQ